MSDADRDKEPRAATPPETPAAASETPAAASETPAVASETPAAVSETPAAPPEPPAAGPSEPSGQSTPPPYRTLALALAGALVLVVVLVATGPYWARLLPWGPGAAATGSVALAARLDRVAAAQRQVQPQLDQAEADAKAALQRVAALKATAASVTDLADLRHRIAQAASATDDLGGRVDALAKAAAARAAAASDLQTRVAALDKAVRAQAARDKTATGLAIVLLQLRDAVAAGRPFAAAYQALVTLSHEHPQIAAAAAPLAGPAKTGLATRAALARRLHALAGAIVTAEPAPAKPGWQDAMLRRLRGLVTIRRIGGPGQSASEAAVHAAEAAMAGGDVAGAVAALDKLKGAPASVAAPWLHAARKRVAAEAALHRLEALLTARLGQPEAAPPAARSPG